MKPSVSRRFQGRAQQRGAVLYVALMLLILLSLIGVVEILLGVEAAGKSLEAVARPLNAVRRGGGRSPAAVPARPS
jgi:hypothetical protein